MRPIRLQALSLVSTSTSGHLLSSRISLAARTFSTTRRSPTKNRIFQNVRSPDEFSNLLLLSSSSRQPLLTLWTASWCPSCKSIALFLQHLLQHERYGESIGNGVAYTEVELDSPTIADLPARYLIRSVPTLLAFSRGEAQLETAERDVDRLKDRRVLLEWVENEARREGEGGAGGSLLGALGGWLGR